MKHMLMRSLSTVLLASAAFGVSSSLLPQSAYADDCPNPAGAGPVILCTSVGSMPVSTPPVSLNSPTDVCYVLSCVPAGQPLASVPSQSQTVPVPVVSVRGGLYPLLGTVFAPVTQALSDAEGPAKTTVSNLTNFASCTYKDISKNPNAKCQ